MNLIDGATRFLFFTGKGGVGKTSMACATALALTERGRRVLLVSTDPASNLDQALGAQLSSQPTPVPSIIGLSALNINPEAAACDYRERVIEPYRGALPADAIARMEEQLSGACTVEVAAFDEFTRFIVDEKTVAQFDHVIFDTAPTGHTLRLLQLPAAWSGFLATNEHGASCLGPLSGLKKQQEKYAATVAALSDATRTTLALVVLRPDRSSIKEAERTSIELEGLGLRNQFLIINGVFRATGHGDSVAAALEKRGAEALAAMSERLRKLPQMEVLLCGHNIVGIDALRGLLSESALPHAAAGKEEPRQDWPYLKKTCVPHARKRSRSFTLFRTSYLAQGVKSS